MKMTLKNLLLVVLLCFFSFNLKAECTTTTTGLCTPGVEEVIVETITEDTSSSSTGITTTTTTTSDITTTTITNQDSGDLLDGDNNFVATTKEGDMDSDWGGQGPASMPTGNACYGLGTDKCASITGSGNTTSTMGVEGMGTTFIQTIDISDLNITHGGQTNYTIKVDKQDPADRIYMHVTGKYGNTSVFTGTDILSESGVTSGYQQYSGSFDFSGFLNTVVVEVGGRDISLAVGPLFDDVAINVLYNTVNTIVTQQITTVEMFVALNSDVTEEIIDVVETIFELNEPIDEPDFFNFEPINEPMDDFSFESVEMEMQEFEMEFQMEIDMQMDMNYDMPMDMPATVVMMPDGMEIEMPMEITVVSIEMEMEMQMDLPPPEMNNQPMEVSIDTQTNEQPTDMDIPEPMEPESTDMDINVQPKDIQEPEPMEPEPETTEPESTEPEPEQSNDQETEKTESEPKESEPEPEPEPEPKELEKPKKEPKEEPKKEIKEEPKKEPSAKQKAATKIVKKMGDKGRYEAGNQIKTLIVMQVLGNSKTFFDTQKIIPDVEGFFTNETLPDTMIPSNNIAQYLMFGGSDSLMDQMVDSQYK